MEAKPPVPAAPVAEPRGGEAETRKAIHAKWMNIWRHVEDREEPVQVNITLTAAIGDAFAAGRKAGEAAMRERAVGIAHAFFRSALDNKTKRHVADVLGKQLDTAMLEVAEAIADAIAKETTDAK